MRNKKKIFGKLYRNKHKNWLSEIKEFFTSLQLILYISIEITGLKIRLSSEFKAKSFKVFLIFCLVANWLLTGWPRIPKTNFPPKIEEAKATFGTPVLRGSAVGSGETDNVIGVSPGANITVGKIAIVACVTDNQGTSNGATTNHTISDTDVNTWTRVYEETDSDGADNDGSAASLWWTKVATQIDTGDSITCTTGENESDKIITVFEVTVE